MGDIVDKTGREASAPQRVPVVQFPHPGREHRAKKLGRFAWTRVPLHARKFMRSRAIVRDVDGLDRESDITFWGEWEATSDVVNFWPPEGALPTALHVPVRDASHRVTPGDQNTDPWVFGSHFRYTNCRQQGSMLKLPEGSLILFGSKLADEFVLDTVFVVLDATEPLPLSELKRHPHTDALLRGTTYDPLSGTSGLACGPSDDSQRYVLYRGATPAERPDMFSFTPASAGPSGRFARPAIELGSRPSGGSYVNPANARSTKGAKAADWVPVNEARRVWEDVCQQVLNADLVLAHHIDEPN